MEFVPIASSSKGNAYLLRSQGATPLLIECGIPASHLRVKFWFIDDGIHMSDLAGCLISHVHGDHSRAAKDLLRAGVDIFTSVETALALGIDGHYRVNPIDTERAHYISEWTVRAFDLHHDVPCHGFLIEAPDGDTFLFIPDTSYVRNRFEGVNIIAIECNYIDELLHENIEDGVVPEKLGRRVRRNHMSLDSVIGMLKANDLSRCRSIWLLHLSDQNSDEARMIRTVQEQTGIPCRAAQN